MGEPPPAAPYLSIVVTGRNDDFGGDFNARFFRALEFNHQQLVARDIRYELVFVEWRPVPGRRWLAELLAERYGALVPGTLTSYVVDGAYHAAFSLNPSLQFQEFIAKNVGIRRSRGEFVLATNSDVYLGRRLLDWLAAGGPAPGVLYRATRVDLKDDLDTDALDWRVFEDERNHQAVNVLKPPLYTNAAGDFLLLDRQMWVRLQGFNEVYRVGKVHVDANFCLKADAAGLPITPLEAPVYHMGAGTLNSQRQLYALRPEDAPWGHTAGTRWKRSVVYENAPGWGLGDAETRTVAPGLHYLRFAWAAVPPLVALDRVLEVSSYRDRVRAAPRPPS